MPRIAVQVDVERDLAVLAREPDSELAVREAVGVPDSVGRELDRVVGLAVSVVVLALLLGIDVWHRRAARHLVSRSFMCSKSAAFMPARAM
jgi:hypothetical protein